MGKWENAKIGTLIRVSQFGIFLWGGGDKKLHLSMTLKAQNDLALCVPISANWDHISAEIRTHVICPKTKLVVQILGVDCCV